MFRPLEPAVRIVPLTSILVDVIPKALGEVVVMQHGSVVLCVAVLEQMVMDP